MIKNIFIVLLTLGEAGDVTPELVEARLAL